MRIVVLGAGFAGVEATARLERALRREPAVELTLVSELNYFLFTPLLPQIVSSAIDPRHIVQPIRDLRGSRRFRFRRDRAHAIDLERRRVELASGPLEYQALVVALGARTETFGIPGVTDHARDFKSLEDAVSLRDRVLDLCEHADRETDAVRRRRMLTVVVVGGGYTGIELVCELQDLLFGYVVGRYGGIPRGEIRLVVLEAGNAILRGVDPALARHAARRLAREGIVVRRGAKVVACVPGGVELEGGERLEADTVVWAAGVGAHDLVRALPGPHDRSGRAVVNEHLQLEGRPEVFVVGDAAVAAPDPSVPPVIPVAIRHARIAAANVLHRLRGEPLERYRYAPAGMLVSLGMSYAIASIGGLRLRGRLAWFLCNGVHLLKLVGLKRQLQVALDWALASLFPRDSTIVRRPGGCAYCAEARITPRPAPPPP